MAKYSPLAFLLLAGIVAGPAQAANQRFGRIRIDVPGSWTLKLLDREEEAGGTYKFPWYQNDQVGSFAQNFSWGKPLKSPAGSFTIWPAGGTDVKLLSRTGEDCELKGRTEYLVAFDYGTIGLKAFNHVFYLYGKDKSAFLVKVEARLTDRGNAMNVKLLAQADHSDTSKKFQSRKHDAYLFHANGTLVKAEDNDGSSAYFMSVKKK
jgi:hypothetical protein